MPCDAVALISSAKPAVFWSDRPDAPQPCPALQGPINADLCIIGAGFTGLWAALQALEENPGRHVVLLEAENVAFGASSRNGGLCEASLTHGFFNGLNHWADESSTLERMGTENLSAIIDTAQRHGIDADIHRTDQVSFALADWQVNDLAESANIYTEHDVPHSLLTADEARGVANSPTYLGALVDHDSLALVDPARLAWGLRDAVLKLGASLYEQSRVTSITDAGSTLLVSTNDGRVSADRVVVATNAWAEPLRQIRRYVVPVYDHVLMTEPLSDHQMAEIGWSNRQALTDAANQFHYYRLTSDNRILWGGYDANYYYGNGMGPAYERRPSSHELIAEHFFQTFPQLEGLGFSHRWAGPIGTTSKFTAAFGQGYGKKLAWVAGYAGLGVGASRFGAGVALDLVDGLETERTQLEMVRKKPVPFPPEPLRNIVIQATRRAIARSDQTGRPGLLLRVLARFGVGFNS